MTAQVQQLTTGEANAEVRLNEIHESVFAAAVFSKNHETTSGLTWGYYGCDDYNGNTIANGTVTLTDAATNYIVVLRSTGVVSVSTSTTNATDSLYARLYKVTTSGGAVTAVVDERWKANGLMFNSSGSSGTVTSVDASGGVETVSGSAITSTGTIRGAHAVNAQTGTTYTYVTGDRGKLVTHTNAGAIAGTLPQAGTTGFETKWFMWVQNRGAGTLTITPTTSTIDGSSSLALTTGQGCLVVSDGTNYYTMRGVGSSGAGTVTHTGGALTANAVVLGAGTDDAKVVAGITTDGTSALNLGVAGSSVGKVVLANATSGTITMQPPTGALGTVTVTVPAATDTLVNLTSSQTLTNKTLTSPTLTTPALGTPASGTLTNCTADGTNAVGFRTVPQNSQSAAYTTVLADSGKHILHPAADTNARTFTIDSNANVAYPVGTAITFVNETSQVVTIAITSDTLTLAGSTTTGSRSLAQNGVATALKVTSTKWIISGTGLS